MRKDSVRLIAVLGLSLAVLFPILLFNSSKIDSIYDVLFESVALAVVIYIYFIARSVIAGSKKLQFGIAILVFTSAYDIITELKTLDDIADTYEFVDTMIEDGLRQIAYLLIAFGITDLIAKAKESARIDELTGLYNRKGLSKIKLDTFDLIYIDVDGLKRVNDTKGHNVGDLLLIRFAQALKRACEFDEQCFRVGGDEFVIIVKETRGDDFIQSLSSILHGEPISYSFGIETTNRLAFDEAMRRTDAQMYKMKQRHKEDVFKP